MRIEAAPAFQRDLKRVRDRGLQRRIARKIEELAAASTLSDVSGVQPLTGWEDRYRIRIGDYRLGIALERDVVVLVRFGPRRDFYRSFP